MWGPRALLVSYAQHYCPQCRTDLRADLAELAPPGSQYTHRVSALAVRIVVEDGVPYRPARGHLWRAHRVFVPCATIQHWGEAGGKKAPGPPGPPLPGLGLGGVCGPLGPPRTVPLPLP